MVDLLNTKHSNIARIESGSFYPSLRLLERIADVFGAKLDIRFIPRASWSCYIFGAPLKTNIASSLPLFSTI